MELCNFKEVTEGRLSVNKIDKSFSIEQSYKIWEKKNIKIMHRLIQIASSNSKQRIHSNIHIQKT